MHLWWVKITPLAQSTFQGEVLQHRDCWDKSLLCAFHALREVTSRLSTLGIVISERCQSPGIFTHVFVILILRYSATLSSHSFKKRQPQMSHYVLLCKLWSKAILIYFQEYFKWWWYFGRNISSYDDIWKTGFLDNMAVNSCLLVSPFKNLSYFLILISH